MSKDKIVSIEIELKNYEPIKFTMQEARELHEQLDALFGKKEVVHKHYRDYWWNQPYYTWTNQSNCLIGGNPDSASASANINTWLANNSVVSENTGMKVSYEAA